MRVIRSCIEQLLDHYLSEENDCGPYFFRLHSTSDVRFVIGLETPQKIHKTFPKCDVNI